MKSSKRSLRDLVYTGPWKAFKFCGDPGEILSKRSFHENLEDDLYCRCLSSSSCGMLL